MTLSKSSLLALCLAACSAPTRTEPTTQSQPTGSLPGDPNESMPMPGDAGGVVPEPPPSSTTPAEEPGALRRAAPRDIAQAPVDAGVGGGGGGRDAGMRDAGAPSRDAGTFGDAGIGGDAGVSLRDAGISGGGDAGAAGPR